MNISFSMFVLLLQLYCPQGCSCDLPGCSSVQSRHVDSQQPLAKSQPGLQTRCGIDQISESLNSYDTGGGDRPFLDPGWIPSFPLMDFFVILRLLGIVVRFWLS